MTGIMVRHEPGAVAAAAAAAAARAQVAFLLESPGISEWLKAALRAADGHDAIGLQNDIEILRHLIAPLASVGPETAMRPLALVQAGTRNTPRATSM